MFNTFSYAYLKGKPKSIIDTIDDDIFILKGFAGELYCAALYVYMGGKLKLNILKDDRFINSTLSPSVNPSYIYTEWLLETDPDIIHYDTLDELLAKHFLDIL